ncbi:hypothetical protein AB0892_07770 [Streptomyces sp. NPDC005409]|uniref:hypothetical protein n=1 Tax=Streptomyces sp. NPDC005409 TaxID=3155342 RepID=UPI003452830B
MVHIKFWDVFCPVLARTFEPIILRVDEEEIFHGSIEQSETLSINVRVPIQTIKVELGTSDIDGLGEPIGPFRNFVYLEPVNPFHTEEHDSLKLTLFDESISRALFRSKIPGHEGKFELSFSVPG